MHIPMHQFPSMIHSIKGHEHQHAYFQHANEVVSEAHLFSINSVDHSILFLATFIDLKP